MKKLGILREITLYLEKDNQNISLQNASSGELLILSTLTFISSYIEPNSTILIDEPENSLHPKWQKEYIGKILDMFYYYHPKIIIATHSALMIPLKEQPINLFSIENSIIKKLKRTTNNNEELLSDTFKIVVADASAYKQFGNSVCVKVIEAIAKQLVEAGADVLVAGSFVFKSENPTQTIADLKKLGYSVIKLPANPYL